MKIAIFENEFELINTIFDTTNYYYFNNKFEFEYFPSSQKFAMEKIQDYSLLIIDIDLSQKSELDGYGLIAKIIQFKNPPPIVILTGHSKINESLEKKGLPAYPILIKPIGVNDVKEILSKYPHFP